VALHDTWAQALLRWALAAVALALVAARLLFWRTA
jgi:hypothetical protein